MSVYTITPEALLGAAEQYRSPAFATLLKALGGASSLELTEATRGTYPDDGANFYLVGTLHALALAIPDVELYVLVGAASSVEFQLFATLPSITLRALSDHGLLPAQQLNDISPLLDTSFDQAELRFVSQGQKLYIGILDTDLGHSATSVGPLEQLTAALHLSVKNLGFELVRDFAPESVVCTLMADIGFGDLYLDTRLALPLGTLVPASTWTLELATPLHLSAGLKALFGFIEQLGGQALGGLFSQSQIGAAFDKQLQQIPAFLLETLSLQIDPRRPALRMVTFALQSDSPLSIVGDSFVINELGVSGFVGWAGSTTTFALTLSGVFAISDAVTLDLSLDIPGSTEDDWVLTMEGGAELESFADLSSLPIETPVGELHLPSDFLTVSAVQINIFEVRVSQTGAVRSILFDVAVTMAVGIPHGLMLQNPRLLFTLLNPFSKAQAPENRQLTGSLSSGILIGDILFEVSATKVEQGWSFSGSTAGAIKAARAVEALEQHFHIVLPAFVRDIELDSLAISFSTTAVATDATDSTAASKELTFTCAGRMALDGGGDGVALTLFIDLKSEQQGDKTSYSRSIRGNISVKTATTGELIFDLNVNQSTVDTGFLAAYRRGAGGSSINLTDLVATLAAADSPVRRELPAVTINIKDCFFVYDKRAQSTLFLFGLDVGAGISLSNLPLVGKALPAGESASIDNLRLLVASADVSQARLDAINALIPGGIAPIAGPTPPAAPGTGTAQGTGANPTAGGAAPQGPGTGGEAPQSGGTTGTGTTQIPPALSKGVTVSAALSFGGAPQSLALPVGGAGGQQAANPTTTAPVPTSPVGTTTADGAKWFVVQKKLGPLELQRVGVQYKDAVLWVLLDAALSAGGLSLALMGLGAGSPLSSFDPRFSLRGLGVDYNSEALEIGGALLKMQAKDEQGQPYDGYAGAAVVKAKELTLSAIGAYSSLNGHPSLFVYAVLDYPLGGPSFFFVTGLAGGFGYNRALVIPPVEQVAQFPLVQRAMGAPAPSPPANVSDNQQPQSPAVRAAAELGAIAAYVPPATGEIFLAVGVKFTSFKLIDSFVLLTLSFGRRFELNVLGLSTLLAPPAVPGEPPVEPIAEVQLALKASFVPDEGFLGVSAQLTSASYVLARACHLTGGFAFYSWFKGDKAGDFALTLGGYHPSYKVPAHYPRVPRLGLNWQIDPSLAVKGELYFALTASAVMAGGQLQAIWNKGGLKAWFHLAVDIIVSWKPYFYDARADVGISVSYTFNFLGTHTINVDVGASLHIWGPPFSGTAHVKITVIEFDVAFGDAKPRVQALNWPQFKAAFLPHTAGADSADPPAEAVQCCSVAVAAGLMRKASQAEEDLGVLSAKGLVLVTNTVIPSSAAHIVGDIDVVNLSVDDVQQPLPFLATDKGATPKQQHNEWPPRPISPVGVAPVALRQLSSTHTITITWRPPGKDDAPSEPAEHKFSYTPVLKRLPAALWGPSLTPDLGRADFVEDALAGFTIRPAQDVEPVTAEQSRGDWRYQVETVPDAFQWETADVPELNEAERARLTVALAALTGAA